MKLSIGEFSRLCGVTVKTLRHYQKIGLLVPNQVDRYSGYRFYSVEQLQKMLAIRQLKSVGFSLDELVDLYQSSTHHPDVDMLEQKIRDTEQQLLLLRDRRDKLMAMLNSRKKHETMEQFSIQSLPACTVASYRGTIASYDDLGRLCCELIGPEMQRLGCECSEPGYCFTRELDKEYRPTDIRIEYCEQVKVACGDSEILSFYDIPAVEEAVCMKCYGPYDRLFAHYAEAFAYIEQQGYVVTEAPRAVYIDGCWNQEDPERWLTIIQFPVRRNN